MSRPCALYWAFLLLPLASSSSSCPDGTESYGNFALLSVSAATDAFQFSSFVGTRSDTCSLPVTPSAGTFGIWGYIYSQEAILSLPGQLEPEELFHLSKTNEASREWYQSFAGARQRSNQAAVEAIERMECHMAKAAHLACETAPRPFACCTFTQHHTWLRVARVLSDLILTAYGDQCGTRLVADALLERAFAHRVGEIVRTLPVDGVDGRARRAALATVAWALRGACGDGRRDACRPLDNVTAVQRAELDALRDQGDAAWLTALACTPSLPGVSSD